MKFKTFYDSLKELSQPRLTIFPERIPVISIPQGTPLPPSVYDRSAYDSAPMPSVPPVSQPLQSDAYATFSAADHIDDEAIARQFEAAVDAARGQIREWSPPEPQLPSDVGLREQPLTSASAEEINSAFAWASEAMVAETVQDPPCISDFGVDPFIDVLAMADVYGAEWIDNGGALMPTAPHFAEVAPAELELVEVAPPSEPEPICLDEMLEPGPLYPGLP